MLPAAKAASIPVPTALRPAGEIKVRKRRENRSSTSSVGGTQHSTCSESEAGSLNLTWPRSSPVKTADRGSPPSIVEPASPTLHRRKSSKNKVLSKVLGSIQTSRSSPGLQPTHGGQSDGSIFRKLSLRRRPSFQARSRSSDFPVQPSTPSLPTSSSTRTTLRPGLPSPKSPQSGSSQHLSLHVADQASPRPKSDARGPPPILTVDLNVKTECEALSLHEERCVWVAVEARGVVKTDVRDVRRNEGAGLDVVVVLDNSRFASPESLETACDVALRIAQISSDADDRLAVFCTCCRHFPDEARTSGCLLHPLRAVNTTSIRKEIQDIRDLAAHPPAAGADLNETLREAIKILKEPTDKAVQPLRIDRCHIFVLSPQPLGGLESKDEFSPININAVCTAVVPYHGTPPETPNIWLLPRTPPSDFFPAKVAVKDSTHLVAQAADVISYARDGRGFGAITDLCLDIRPRQSCIVESLLGNTSSTKLKAGQTISALVRVRIPAVSAPGRRNTQISPATDLENAFEDLENLLGETIMQILNVKAHHRQSCFPDNNLVTVEQACAIRRPNPLSQWSIAPPTDTLSVSRIETELYQRFVFLIATQDPPQVALDTLGTFYQNQRCSLPCSSYVERVRQELIYQLEAAPLSAKSSAGNSASSTSEYSPQYPTFLNVPEFHTSSHAQGDYNPGLRHFPSQPHFSFQARDSLSFTATLPTTQQVQRSAPASPLTDARRSSPRASPRNPDALDTGGTATTQTGKCTSTSDDADSSSVDEARAIWRHMRRNVSIRASSPSRGTPSWPTGYRSVGQRAELAREHRERELKRKALANKRSIGADTLRSLSMSSEAGGSEARAAPWLL